MTLYYTPRSHFSRKVRIVADAAGIPLDCVDVGDVGAAAAFGDNPLMKVPALATDVGVLFDADHIAAWLTRRHDPSDWYGVLTTDATVLNLRAVMNGVMAAEVEVILAQRSGIETAGLARFDKLHATIRGGLDWLEAHVADFPAGPTYAGFHLVCLWDHLALYGLVDLAHPGLAARVAALSALPYVARSAPT